MNDFDGISQLTGQNDYLTELIAKILQLEYQLNHCSEQSWYFIHGLKSQQNRLDSLTREFESFRTIVNDFSIEELKALLKIENKKLSGAEKLKCSRRSRVMAHNIARGRINTIRLYQNVKRDIGEIPKLSFFRE